MPIKSAKQFRLMQAAKMGGVGGVDPSVATEMLGKTSHADKSAFASADRPSRPSKSPRGKAFGARKAFGSKKASKINPFK